MDNFFTDNRDMQLLFDNTDLGEIINLKEGDFSEAEKYDYAFTDAEDAKEGYREVLTLIGEVAAQIIAPLAPEVDEEGAHFDHGKVTYAKGTQHAMDVLAQSNLTGFTLPRKYGGLNFPTFVYTLAVEMVSQADASLMNLFGLQDIGETIYEFADEEQKQKYLPRFSSGTATGAMALTEPDAGSDLQAVQLKATFDEADNTWRLNGVKRFITNGCGDILLVLARSEPGTRDGRGLSMFIVEKDESLVVRRIENKLGIHGSPTCELQFNNTRGYLVGKRRMGLIRYVMALMNGARLGIAAQGLGIAQAAYLEGLEYAKAREQFGTAIVKMPLVYEMLVSARVNIEAARMLTYYTSTVVDLKKGYDKLLEESEPPDKELRQKSKYYTSLASLLTPMAKYVATELANKVAYDMLQIHGGTGYMRDFNIERHYRDARITNIYEGTTQLQYVAAIGGVVTRVWEAEFDRFEAKLTEEWRQPYLKMLRGRRELLSKAVEFVRSRNDHEYQSYYQDKLVDMATRLFIGYLFVEYAAFSEDKKKTMDIFFEKEMPVIEKHFQFVMSGKARVVEEYAELLLRDS
jgi:alkylation response protein AidB-like acyl-CoA dehydrogenase